MIFFETAGELEVPEKNNSKCKYPNNCIYHGSGCYHFSNQPDHDKEKVPIEIKDLTFSASVISLPEGSEPTIKIIKTGK